MMFNIIKYNNEIIPAPTPMVAISKDLDINRKKIGEKNKIELNGQITGDFLSLQSGQQELINIFSKNFKTFEIYEKNNQNNYDKIYEKNYIVVKDINFKESNYSKILDYSISLESQDFINNVNNPINEFSFNQSLDRTTLTHKISAEGINTSASYSNALDNAIDFVRSYSGLSQMPSAMFVTGEKYCLTSFQESIDRINGKYEIQESYTAANFNSGVLQYNLEISSGIKNNFINLSLQGSYVCGLNEDIDDFEQNINYYNLATGLFSGFLSPILLDFSLNKNKDKNSISFSCAFNDDPRPNPYIQYRITKNKNYIYDTTETSIDGEVVYRGHLKEKHNEIDALNVLPDFNEFGFLKSSSVAKTSAGKFTFNKTYSNQNMPQGFVEGNYTATLKPSIVMKKYVPSAVAPIYFIQNFGGATLEKVQLQGSFKGSGARMYHGIHKINPGDIISLNNSYDPSEKIWQYNLEAYSLAQNLSPVDFDNSWAPQNPIQPLPIVDDTPIFLDPREMEGFGP